MFAGSAQSSSFETCRLTIDRADVSPPLDDRGRRDTEPGLGDEDDRAGGDVEPGGRAADKAFTSSRPFFCGGLDRPPHSPMADKRSRLFLFRSPEVGSQAYHREQAPVSGSRRPLRTCCP